MTTTHGLDVARLDVLAGASNAFDGIAEYLIGLHQAWKAAGADPAALIRVEGLIVDAGWWSGRLLAEADLGDGSGRGSLRQCPFRSDGDQESDARGPGHARLSGRRRLRPAAQ